MTSQPRNDDPSRNREQEGQYSSESSFGKQDPTKNKDKDKEKEGRYGGGSTGSQPGQGGMGEKPPGGNV